MNYKLLIVGGELSLKVGLLCLLGNWASAQRVICPADYQDITGRGLLAIEAGAGTKASRGITGTLGMAYYIQSEKNFARGQYHFPNMFIKANLAYAQDKLKEEDRGSLDHAAFTFDLAFGYIPFNIKDIVYPSLFAGAFLANDFLTGAPNAVSAETKSRLNSLSPGGLFGLEIMTFFGHPRLALVVHADQRYLARDTFWGAKRQYFWLGLRYHLMDVKRVKH